MILILVLINFWQKLNSPKDYFQFFLELDFLQNSIVNEIQIWPRATLGLYQI